MDYLTENAVFTCNQGGVIRCKDSGNNSVKFKGATLMTTGATLSSKAGICSILTAAAQGSPQPCKCQLTTWIPGFSPMKNSNGKPLLTDSAKNLCTFGGAISVQNSGVFGKITTGFAPASMTIKPVAANNLKKSAEEIPAAKNIEIKSANSAAIVENSSATEKTLKKKIPALFCAYNENDEKCRNCDYPKSSTKIDNDSTQLGKNYIEYIKDAANCDEVDEYYLKVQDDFEFQAHHLISGNQIFAPIKKDKNKKKINRRAKLVRLANFCGFDINNPKNCIMLVANDDEYGKKAGGKSASAYDTMSLSKIQWHVGGHSYTFSAEEIERIKARIHFYTKKNTDDPLLNYVQLVSAELDKLECRLSENVKCRNTPEEKQALIESLNNLSKKLKKYLGAFKEKPQRSFPYYVSKLAYLFAFDLPRAAKIILVSRADSDFKFEKFRAERFDEILNSDSGKKLNFNPKDEKIFSLNTREDKVDCIEFCENVEFFILADGVNFCDIVFLPNDENFSKNIGGEVESGAKFLDSHETEILVWLREMQGNYQYTAIAKKIRERIGKL